ncbi:MAG: hypothetical protein ACLUZZ_09015 [Alistipes inops]
MDRVENMVMEVPAEGFGSIDLEAGLYGPYPDGIVRDTGGGEKAAVRQCAMPEEIHVVGRQSVGSNGAGRE